MGLDRLAWRALAARPLRTVLTIIGVALGVLTLVVLGRVPVYEPTTPSPPRSAAKTLG